MLLGLAINKLGTLSYCEMYVDEYFSDDNALHLCEQATLIQTKQFHLGALCLNTFHILPTGTV